MRLQTNPYPSPNNRIKCLEGHHYCLAYQAWRIYFQLQGQKVTLLNLISGYDQETLDAKKESRWPDVHIHRAYTQYFSLGCIEGYI